MVDLELLRERTTNHFEMAFYKHGPSFVVSITL